MKLQYIHQIDLPVRERTIPELLRRQTERFAERPILRFEDQVFTYKDAGTLSDKLAAGLALAGVTKGSHVGFMIDNRPEVLWLYFAIAKLGAVAVPMNTAAKGDQLVYFVDFFDVTTYVVEDAYLERLIDIHPRTPKLERVIILGNQATPPVQFPLPTYSFETLGQCDAVPPAVSVHFGDVAQIGYTSGTTGPSKGCLATQASVVSSAVAYSQAFGYREDDVIYTCLPLFHSNAYSSSCLAAISTGASIALSRRFSISNFWPEIRRMQATQFNALGAMATIIWNQPPSPADRDHQVRLAFLVPMPAFAREFAERFNLRTTGVYGLTDFGCITLLRPDRPDSKWQSAGQVRPEVALAIVDQDDLPVPPGTPGEICVRPEGTAPLFAQGYYKMAESTCTSRRNLWFHTGDHGYLDVDGYLYFSDRVTDSVRRRGENISAHEVEQVLLTHPGVADAAVFGVPCELGDQEVVASIVRREGTHTDPADLVRYCQDRMAYYMVPRYLQFVDDFPKTSTQKVEKFKLRNAAIVDQRSLWDREAAGIRVTRGR